MPSTVYAVKRDLNRYQVAATRIDALERRPLVISDFGQGNQHKMGMAKKLSKSVITINGVLQAPLADTLLEYTLAEPSNFDDQYMTLTGIGTIRVGDIMFVNQEEYVVIDNIGFATTPQGPITNSGTFPLIEVERGTLGTIGTSHANGSTMGLYRGNFNIVGSDIIFTEAPDGRGDQQINESNLVELNASFQEEPSYKRNTMKFVSLMISAANSTVLIIHST